MRCISNFSWPCLASANLRTAENRTLCRARALGKRVSVCSPRARAPAGGRSRCGFAKQIRGFSAQSLSQISMRCRSGVLPRPQPINGFPKPRRIELYAGRERKESATATQGGTRFPNGRPTETAFQNIGSEWDAFSGWVASGKFIPESALRTGHAFPMAVQAESSSRNPASNWDALSAPSPQLQNLRALHSKTG